MLRRLSPFLRLVSIVAVPAAAQPPAGAELNQSIDAGLQWALLISASDATPGMQVSWRRLAFTALRRRNRWALGTETHDHRISISPAQPGPDGVLIPAMRGREDRRIPSDGFGGGVLARSVVGRLSLIGGAGTGVFLDRSTNETRVNAAEHARSITVRSIGLYALVEMEARATRRLSAYVGLRVGLPRRPLSRQQLRLSHGGRADRFLT